MPRTTSNRPGFLTSDQYAETLAAFIWDAAERVESENGHGARSAADVRMARRAAREILTAAGVEPATVLPEVGPPAVEPSANYQ